MACRADSASQNSVNSPLVGNDRLQLDGPILFVDDEPVLREATRQLIARGIPECSVLAFSNGPEALRAVDHQRPSIAILDVDMVPMAGPEVGTALRARWPLLPIMFITGTAKSDLIPVFERLGAVTWLRKPVMGRDLLAAIEQHGLRRTS